MNAPVPAGGETLERSIREIGADLASAFPSSARHPVRALDRRAMDLASADQELKAALFRFVDVSPACRSLDELARHAGIVVGPGGYVELPSSNTRATCSGSMPISSLT